MGLQIVSPSAAIRQTAFAHSAPVTKRVPVVIGGQAFLPVNSALANAETNYIYRAELQDAPKAAGEAWAVGQAIYWSAANSNFTTTSASNTLCGHALQPADSAATESPLFEFDSFAA